MRISLTRAKGNLGQIAVKELFTHRHRVPPYVGRLPPSGRRHGKPLRNGAALSESYAAELGHLKLPLTEPRNRTLRPENNEPLQPSPNCEFSLNPVSR